MDFLNPAFVYKATNLIALVGWLAIAIAAPSRPWASKVWRVTGIALPVFFALIYITMMALDRTSTSSPGGSFSSLEGVQILFTRPALVAAGWVHYLAFDMFIGTWMSRRAGELEIPHWQVLPCLFFTLMLGPIGFLLFSLLVTVKGKALFAHAR
jgi:Domain of unknown function (DUF4281)